jgi:hypothetical protein
MIELIAKKRLPYAGKVYPAGAAFSASAKDARILTLAGIASPAEPEATVTRPRRQYRRRDMRAEA